MTRIKRDPAATPEQDAARRVQNSARLFADRADRFAGVCARHAEDLTPDARVELEAWVRGYAEMLIAATQTGRLGGDLQLVGDDEQSAPAPTVGGRFDELGVTG